jgi:hypothetical protein
MTKQIDVRSLENADDAKAWFGRQIEYAHKWHGRDKILSNSSISLSVIASLLAAASAVLVDITVLTAASAITAAAVITINEGFNFKRRSFANKLNENEGIALALGIDNTNYQQRVKDFLAFQAKNQP